MYNSVDQDLDHSTQIQKGKGSHTCMAGNFTRDGCSQVVSTIEC